MNDKCIVCEEKGEYYGIWASRIDLVYCIKHRKIYDTFFDAIDAIKSKNPKMHVYLTRFTCSSPGRDSRRGDKLW